MQLSRPAKLSDRLLRKPSNSCDGDQLTSAASFRYGPVASIPLPGELSGTADSMTGGFDSSVGASNTSVGVTTTSVGSSTTGAIVGASTGVGVSTGTFVAVAVATTSGPGSSVVSK